MIPNNPMLTLVDPPDQEFIDIANFVTTHMFTLKKPLTIIFKEKGPREKRAGVCHTCGTKVEVNHGKYRGPWLFTLYHELRHVEQFQYNLFGHGSRMWEKDADKHAVRFREAFQNFIKIN